MKFLLRPALALVLVGSAATMLTACDYASLSPGENPQYGEGFSNPPGYTNMDINRDSVNNKEVAPKPIGKGSAADLKKGSVNDQLNSAPSGDNNTSPQTASGKMGSTSQNQSNVGSPGAKTDGSGSGNGGSKSPNKM